MQKDIQKLFIISKNSVLNLEELLSTMAGFWQM